MRVGADVNTRDAECATVLHLAAEEGRVRTARLLLPLCKDVNPRARDGETPLIRAAKRGKI